MTKHKSKEVITDVIVKSNPKEDIINFDAKNITDSFQQSKVFIDDLNRVLEYTFLKSEFINKLGEF